jgi:hypothetical protein
MSSLAEVIAREVVCAKFPGRLFLTLGEALVFTPAASAADPESAGYQRFLRSTYPFPTQIVGNQRVVSVVAIALAVAGESPPPHRPHGRGRPRKVMGGGA